MPDALADYFQALERLKEGHPVNIRKGAKITNDNVSLEAGRKKGSIKKSRPIFADLISDIQDAAVIQANLTDSGQDALNAAKADAKRYRVLWEEALGREVSLFQEFENAQRKWAKERAALTGEKIALINAKRLRGSQGAS